MENSGVARLRGESGDHWTARSCIKGKLLVGVSRAGHWQRTRFVPALAAVAAGVCAFVCVHSRK